MSPLPPWPPSLEDEQRDELSNLAATWALSHGLVYFPVSPTDRGSVIHAPFTLLPSPFPRVLFQRAQTLQKFYNVLYSRIALDRAFLDAVMGDDGGDSHGIHVIRYTLETLSTCATLDDGSNLLVKPSHSPALPPSEISVVYFRATYTPNDFKLSTDWPTRILLEQSRAIKCPSLPLQLAGGKMIQAVLAAPGVLERFIGRTDEEKQWIPLIRNSWMEMWPLASSPQTSAFISSLDTIGVSDTTNPQPSADRSGITRASELYSHLVLKPQREGGGNNVYHDSIPSFLKSLEANLDEARAWIAMRLIQPPKSGSENYLVGAGTAKASKKDTVSELGVFGWSLFGGKDNTVDEKTVGWLVRTKGRESDEGGVAVGYSVIDSLTLI
ncbi:hypothetical protein FRC11_005531 [Ceratobasidium sp. 423]|nr:hypothetical protein FRC11_005531 [Ceratobasidium sp. 423]